MGFKPPRGSSEGSENLVGCVHGAISPLGLAADFMDDAMEIRSLGDASVVTDTCGRPGRSNRLANGTADRAHLERIGRSRRQIVNVHGSRIGEQPGVLPGLGVPPAPIAAFRSSKTGGLGKAVLPVVP